MQQAMPEDSRNKASNFFQKNPVLKIKEFRFFLLIRFTLIFALNLQTTAVFYWVFHITGSKLALGFVGLAEVIPAVLCSLFSGYIVDKNEKRKMLLRCITGYIFIACGLFSLSTSLVEKSLTGTWQLNFIYLFVFAGGAIRAFLGPSMFSLVGLIVPRELYPNATGWSSMMWQIGAVLGPVVSGALIAAWKGSEASLFITIIFELSLLIPISFIATKPIVLKSKEPVLKSISEGLQFVFNTPVLLSALCLDMFSVLFGGAVALLPVYQTEILHVDERGFGLLRAAPGIGALVTLGLLAFLPLKTNPGKKLLACIAGFGLSIICFGLSTNFILSFFMLVLSGMFDAVSVVIRGTILQLVTPNEMRGRVSAVNTMFISSSNELGDFESGVMAQWLGTVRAVVVGGCLTLCVVTTAFFKAPQLKNFKYDD
ncbi:MAG: MFS transporter [Chitinophagaceae bacterium]|jgi:MFS family permease|nr:MFS transporter [Chitinophagaceae bacterium]